MNLSNKADFDLNITNFVFESFFRIEQKQEYRQTGLL